MTTPKGHLKEMGHLKEPLNRQQDCSEVEEMEPMIEPMMMEEEPQTDQTISPQVELPRLWEALLAILVGVSVAILVLSFIKKMIKTLID